MMVHERRQRDPVLGLAEIHEQTKRYLGLFEELLAERYITIHWDIPWRMRPEPCGDE